MFLLLQKLGSGYKQFMEWGDSRTESYPLMGSPWPCLTILFLYVYFIFDYGPKMMKNKEPRKVNEIMKVYNIIQICLNCIGVYWGATYWFQISLLCTPRDHPDLTTAHYSYFLLKIIDLIDTVFFILRKKYSHISFLHLYHHISMLVGGWVSCKFFPGGQLYYLGFVNCFVHVVMYWYYFLTTYDAEYKKSIWWKRHITQLQLTQHCFIFISFLVPLLNPNCGYSKPLLASMMLPVALMIYLFADFYIKAYVKKKPE